MNKKTKNSESLTKIYHNQCKKILYKTLELLENSQGKTKEECNSYIDKNIPNKFKVGFCDDIEDVFFEVYKPFITTISGKLRPKVSLFFYLDCINCIEKKKKILVYSLCQDNINFMLSLLSSDSHVSRNNLPHNLKAHDWSNVCRSAEKILDSNLFISQNMNVKVQDIVKDIKILQPDIILIDDVSKLILSKNETFASPFTELIQASKDEHEITIHLHMDRNSE